MPAIDGCTSAEEILGAARRAADHDESQRATDSNLPAQPICTGTVVSRDRALFLYLTP